MRNHFTLALCIVIIALSGCSRYGEGDKLFIDVTEGGIEHSAYIQASVLAEEGEIVTVHIDNLHCETDCALLPGEQIRQYRSTDGATFNVDAVQPWEVGKAAYDKRMEAYRTFTQQLRERGALFRIEPSLLASTRLMMQQEGFSDVVAVVSLAEFEQTFFTDEGQERQMREVLEAFPGFFIALKEKQLGDGHYQIVRRLRTEADLGTLVGNSQRYYLNAVFHELQALQAVYRDYLLPEDGADLKAMKVHFRYLDNKLVDSASQALADFYSDNCQYLPAGMDCTQYRASFRQHAMHRLVTRLKDNLKKIVATRHLGTEGERVRESVSLFRFVLNASTAFPEASPLLSQEEIDRIVR